MSNIFISYSRKDIDLAQKIVSALAENNLDTWVDWRSIPKGEDWKNEIYRGIEAAETFIFLMSPDSAQSEICNEEIAHAMENNKRIVPIVIRDTNPKEFVSEDSRKEISRRNWIFCRDHLRELPKAVQEIIETINTDYEWLKYHTKLQVRALEWERSNRDHSLLFRGRELEGAELQLALHSAKEPNPTELQHAFVFKSGQVTDRQRKNTTIIAIIVSIAMAAVATFGFYQAKLATDRANIVLARQLAIQSQNLNPDNGTTAIQSGLIAVESAKRGAGWAADQALRRYLTFAALPKEQITFDNTNIMSLSPDGRYVITKNGDDDLHVWDLETRTKIAHLENNDHTVTSVVFSPDGKHILLKRRDAPNQIWETETWTEIAQSSKEVFAVSPNGKYMAYANGVYIFVQETMTGEEVARMKHTENSRDYVAVTAVAFSSDGRYIVSGSTNAIIRVWEATTGAEVSQTNLGSGVDYFVIFSPDGKYIVASTRDSAISKASIIVLETATLTETAQITHGDYVTSLAFNHDGRYIISGSADGIVRVWATRTGYEFARVAHDGYVKSVTFSRDGRYAISAGSDGIIHMWEASTKANLMLVNNISSDVTTNSFSNDSKYIALGNNYSAVVKEIATGFDVTEVDHNNRVGTVAFSPDGKTIVSEGGDIHVWEAETGDEITFIENSYWTPLQHVSFSPDGKYGMAVTIGLVDTVRLWDVITGETVKTLNHDDLVNAATFSPDGKFIAAGSQDGSVYIWEATAGKITSKLKHDDAVYSVAFSPDGRYVVSGSWDRTVRVWQVFSGVEIARMSHDGIVNSIVFSPDGRYIVSGSSDGTARVWSVNNFKEIARMKHNGSVNTAMFSPDGKYVLSGSADGEVRVWEITTELEIASVTHNYEITSVAFSPNGKYVVSRSVDGIVRVWYWQIDNLVTEVCKRLPRNLTHEEWAQYIGNESYKATCPNLPIEPEITTTP